MLGSRPVLQNNGGDNLTVAANGSLTFRTALASGATYNVTVRSQPSVPDQACSVTNGRGTVGSADVSAVVVSCTTGDFTIGGTVSDLTGSGLVLRSNGADELTIDASGRFTFDRALPAGASYSVTFSEQPANPSQICTLSNGSGTVGFTNVTNVTVQCSTAGFLIGGHVRQLRGAGLLLQSNGGDDLAIASNGRFNFSTPVLSGGSYNITVARQRHDPQQTCTVSRGSGTIGNSDIDDVEIRCRRDDAGD